MSNKTNDEKQFIGRVYKVVYLDDPKEFYIGSTIKSLSDRWIAHKSDARHEYYNMALHCLIREFGEEKFKMEEIEAVVCTSRSELRQHEQRWKDELKPTMNDRRAYGKDKERYKRKWKVYSSTQRRRDSQRRYSQRRRAAKLEVVQNINTINNYFVQREK